MTIKFFGGIGPVTRTGLIRDVLAGMTAAAIDIPQVLGYARIAGAPLVAGLYTVLLPIVAFAALGSSRHLVVAADSATAAILSSSVSHMGTAGSAHYLALMSAAALVTCGMLLLARVFRLGFLADFLSRTVLVGFLTGVGLQVCISMLSDMSGVAVDSRYTLVRAWEVFRGLSAPHVRTLLLSGGVTACLLLGNRFARRLPLSLLVVVGTIIASASLDFAAQGIVTLGVVAGGLPKPGIPDVSWAELLALLPVSGSCFVMIIAQSAATSRGFGLKYREAVDSDTDNLGLAAANAAAGFTGTFVVNGSPSQTAMAERMGARTQIAQLTLACVVLVVLLFLTKPLQFLPRCVLASIVFSIAVSMVDVAGLRGIRRESPGEFTLAIITAGTVVAIGVEQGILLAIALSLFRHVRHSYRPHTMMLEPDSTGEWVPRPAVPGRVTVPGMIVYRFGADLFYANCNHFADEVRALVKKAPAPLRWLIVDCSAITDIDYSAAHAIRDLLAELQAGGVAVLFGRVSPYMRADMDRHGLSTIVGDTRVFATLHAAVALARGAPDAEPPARPTAG